MAESTTTNANMEWPGAMDPMLDAYKAFVQGSHYDELYKWQIAKTVQDNWDLNAPDLAGMIDRSFAHEHQNLWSGLHFLPKAMLLEWAQRDVEDARSALRDLLHGTAPLADRMRNFEQHAKDHVQSARPAEKLNTYQDMRAMALWLGMVLPEQHYLYKSSMVKGFCELTGRVPLAKPGDKYTVIDAYYQLCEEVRELLLTRPDIVEAHRALRDAGCHADAAQHLLVQDFIYFVAEHMQKINTDDMDKKEEEFIKTLRLHEPEDQKAFLVNVEEVLRALDIGPDDQRVTYTCRTGRNLALTIGQRYCLSLSPEENGLFGFIVLKKGKEVDVDYGQYGGAVDALYGRTNRRIRLRENWNGIVEACRAEVARTRKASGFRKFSNPYFEKAVFDNEYRSSVLGQGLAGGSPGLIMVNLTWNSNDWKGPSEDPSNHKWVKAGNTPMESWNFDLENPRNPADQVLGFVQHTAPPRLEGDNNLVIFHSAGKVVGFYGKGRFLKDKPLATDGKEYNIIGNRSLSLVLTNKLVDIKTKGYLEEKQRMGMNGFIYLKEQTTALKMIEEAIALNPDQRDKLNALRSWFESQDESNSMLNKRANTSKEHMHPLNTILYGPPGTGKTYHAITHAVAIIDNLSVEDVKAWPREKTRARYHELVDSRLVRTVTFHQSFTYEDFIEGIKPETHVSKDGDEEVKRVTYEVQDGIFKLMCASARTGERGAAAHGLDEATMTKANYYKVSLGQYNSPADDAIYAHCMANNVMAVGYGGAVDVSKAKDEGDIRRILEGAGMADSESFRYTVTVLRTMHLDMKEGDVVMVSAGNSLVRAIGRVSGGYFMDESAPIRFKQFRKVDWLVKDVEIPVEDLYPKNFVMGTLYSLDRNLVKMDYFRKGLSTPEKQDGRYVLIIDEVNRGNVASIFGELITLIEDDKREGGDEPAKLKLPYSKQEFSVPSNLYLLGTMNTADRSVEALDTALRRRFSFVEMPSVPMRIEPKDLAGVDLQAVLQRINERVEQLLDRDHHIGHSYFMKLKSGQDIKLVFANKVLPLLVEYFHGDVNKVGAVLGKAFLKEGKKSVAFAKGFDMDEYGVKEIHTLLDPMKFADMEPFKAIYADA